MPSSPRSKRALAAAGAMASAAIAGYCDHSRRVPWRASRLPRLGCAVQLQSRFYLCGKSSHFLHWTKTKIEVQVVFLEL